MRMRNTNRRILTVLFIVTILVPFFVLPAGANAADAGWRGEYFNNLWLTGAPALVRTDSSIAFDWGTGAPAPGLPADNFSVRWTRTVSLQGGTYRFTTTTDDGVRLYLDGQLLIDQWHDQAATTYVSDRQVTAGDHVVRMEYYDHTGVAVAKLSIDLIGGNTNGSGAWLGEYYANRSLSGAPAMVRNDAQVNFNWGTGSPASQIPADGFSVRWTRDVTFSGGQYRFTTVADDGVRLFVDGNLVIDRWSNSSGQENSVTLYLAAGTHNVRLEYYEDTGVARVSLTWQTVGGNAVGNIITCVRPSNSWVKIYRWEGNGWVDLNAHGWGAIDASGYLKIDGLPVDRATYGDAGQPYRVELWANGSLIRSVGNTSAGQAVFRVRPDADNYTPWGCPAP